MKFFDSMITRFTPSGVKQVPRIVVTGLMTFLLLPLLAAEEEAESTEVKEETTVEVTEETAQPAITLRDVVNSMDPAQLQEAIGVLRRHYIDPAALTDHEINRAAFEGLVLRLDPGIDVVGLEERAEPVPFHAEIFDDRIGYLRLGPVTSESGKKLEEVLKEWEDAGLDGTILDLRGGARGEDPELAVEVLRVLIPRGEPLFSITSIREETEEPKLFTANRDPELGEGVLVLLIDETTGPAGETIAGVLTYHRPALTIGGSSPGRAVRFEEFAISEGPVLRLATSKVLLPDGVALFPDGLGPDLLVEVSDEERAKFREYLGEDRLTELVLERDRPRREPGAAGMVAALQEEQERPRTQVREPAIQRAVDMVTTLRQLRPRGGQ